MKKRDRLDRVSLSDCGLPSLFSLFFLLFLALSTYSSHLQQLEKSKEDVNSLPHRSHTLLSPNTRSRIIDRRHLRRKGIPSVNFIFETFFRFLFISQRPPSPNLALPPPLLNLPHPPPLPLHPLPNPPRQALLDPHPKSPSSFPRLLPPCYS